MQTADRNSTLFQSILALCLKAIDRVIEYKNNDRLKVIPNQFVPVSEINFIGGYYNYDWNKMEDYNYYDWKDDDFVAFLNSELPDLPEYKDAVNQISLEYKTPEQAKKNYALVDLLRNIAKLAPNEEISKSNIEDYVQFFIESYESELNKSEIAYNINVWIGNANINSEQIEIYPNIFLKRPTKNDIQQRWAKRTIIDCERFTGKGLIAKAILSFSEQGRENFFLEPYPPLISEKIEMWLSILRLYKPSNISVVFESIVPYSMFKVPHSKYREKPEDKAWDGKVEQKDISNYDFNLNQTEEENLKEFILNVFPLISEFTSSSYLFGNFYEIALHRYNDSLIKTSINAYRIVASISSFEAILKLDKSDRSLAVIKRIKNLLSCFNFDESDTSSKMQNAYDLRNALLHGDETATHETDLLEFARKHTNEIINYNRICLLIALQLKSFVDKQKFLQLIDNSSNDETVGNKLKEIIHEKVKIPNLNPPHNNLGYFTITKSSLE